MASSAVQWTACRPRKLSTSPGVDYSMTALLCRRQILRREFAIPRCVRCYLVWEQRCENACFEELIFAKNTSAQYLRACGIYLKHFAIPRSVVIWFGSSAVGICALKNYFPTILFSAEHLRACGVPCSTHARLTLVQVLKKIEEIRPNGNPGGIDILWPYRYGNYCY